jgi:Gas vesicle protein K
MRTSDARLKPRGPLTGTGARRRRGEAASASLAEARTHGKRAEAAGFSRAGQAAPLRWNPQPEDVQRSVAQLVLTIVEFLRKLMERQAIRRMEQKTLTRKEVDDVGRALMQLEETVRDIGARFGLTPEDLNLDLGPLGKLM